MISDINKEVDTEVFNNFVPNYKNLATIDQIFSGHLSPKRQVMLEAQLIDSMSAKQVDAGNPDQKTIDESTFKIFLNKFNDKYDSTLLNEQKELLGFIFHPFLIMH